jgi:opacity protein-like surface antigen
MKKVFVQTLWMLMAVLTATLVQAQVQPPACINGSNPLTGERCGNAVTSAVPFLRITPDARGGGMGDVGIATSADANALHYNASKLVFAEARTGFSATYTPWMRNLGLQDVNLIYASGYAQLDEFQALSGSIRFFSLGSIEFTDETGAPLGQGNPNEMEVMAAYSRKLSEKFSAGFGAKFIYSNLATGQVVQGAEVRPGIAFGADLSFTYRTPIEYNDSELTIGGAITNIGSKITYTNSRFRDYIPTNLGIGLAWKFNLDDYNTFTVATDFNKLLVPTPRPEIDTDPADNVADYRQLAPVRAIFRSLGDAPGGFREEMNEITIGGGVEYWYDNQFAIRAGYFYEHFSKGNRKYLNVGLGVKFSVASLNLSYLVPTTNQRNPLDNTFRASILVDLKALSEEE